MIVVVSPHLDDAVFGCGALLAARPGSVVVTVFAAAPADAWRRTDWDALCGFADAGQAMRERRREDAAALGVLGATPCWLEGLDRQYAADASKALSAPADAEAIAALLRPVLLALRPRPIFFPLGLFHPDHLLVHEASRLALAELEGIESFAYEDAIYRAFPGLLEARFAELGDDDLEPEPALFDTTEAHATTKAAAVRCYSSQAPALGAEGMADTARPERYWRLGR